MASGRLQKGTQSHTTVRRTSPAIVETFFRPVREGLHKRLGGKILVKSQLQEVRTTRSFSERFPLSRTILVDAAGCSRFSRYRSCP